MNDRELDALLGKYGDGYNRPPDDPPLPEIRERLHSARSRRSMRQRLAMGIVAAAASLFLAIGIVRDSSVSDRGLASTNNPETAPTAFVADPRSEQANNAMTAALESARWAVESNPGDAFYPQHLEAMESNAEYFRTLQQRQTGRTL